MRKTLYFLLFLIGFVSSTSLAEAHPRKESETEIQFNALSQKTEIIHRFRISDAEEALQNAHGKGLDLLNDQTVQLAFGYLVQDHFMLTANGKKVETEMVGAELQDGSIWVYQESAPLPQTAEYILRFNALIDTFPQQVNIVNVRLYDQVQTFHLFRQAPWVTFSFEAQEAD